MIFLAEAFTRPAMMATLAKAGFNQSYTYFTWKNTKAELIEFMRELTGRVARVLPAELLREHAGHPPRVPAARRPAGVRGAARARRDAVAELRDLLRASSTSRTCPCAEGSEEYLDSEKYEVKERALDGPLLPLVARLNAARRANPALQRLDNLTFLETENEQLLAYASRTGENTVVVIVNLDPSRRRRACASSRSQLGLPPAFAARRAADRTRDCRLADRPQLRPPRAPARATC